MKPTPVIDTADISLAVPLLPMAGTVDFSSGGLKAFFTPQNGGEPIFSCSNESLSESIVFVPASGSVPAYFHLDLPADTREPFSVDFPTSAFADVKWFPDPSRPLRNTWLGRIQIVIHPASDSLALQGGRLSSPRLLPVQPYESCATASPIIVGPQGQNGSDGGGTLSLIAAVSVGGHKVVRPVSGGIAPASASDVAQANTIVGITRGAAMAGDPIDVVFGGEISEPTWSWARGAIYVGENGTLTQTPPTSGFVQRVAVAIEPTKIAVLLGQATVKLGA